MVKRVRYEVPLGHNTPVAIEYDDEVKNGTLATTDPSGSDPPTADPEVYDEPIGGGEEPEEEYEDDDGAEFDETA